MKKIKFYALGRSGKNIHLYGKNGEDVGAVDVYELLDYYLANAGRKKYEDARAVVSAREAKRIKSLSHKKGMASVYRFD